MDKFVTLQDLSAVISEKFLNSTSPGCSQSNHSRNSVVFSQGDVADSVFYVRRGKIKITVASSGGQGAVIALLGGGDFFGQACLAGETQRLATAIALVDCSLTRIDNDSIAALLRSEPDFSSFFLQRMLKRSIRADEDLVDQLFNSSEKRLARALLLLADYSSEAPIAPSIPKISQETLAEMIGTTRSRVSYFMNKFRRLGYINYKAQLEVHASLLTVLIDENAGSGREREPEIAAPHS